jgi:CubicO group peptidase (beta-lactamase class C family)
MRVRALIAIGCLVVPIATSAQSDAVDPLQAQFVASGLPGFCVATADATSTRFAAGFGWSDVARRQAYSADTVQPVGSVSKTIVGLMLAIAVDELRISLDDAVDTHLPFAVRNPHHPAARLTWRQLATHTSSLRDEPAAYERAYEIGARPTQSMADFVRDYLSAPSRELRKRFARAKPGAAFAYTNMGAALAATALETAAGADFAAWSSRKVFQPIGMSATSWQFDAALGERNAVLCRRTGNAGEPLPNYSLVTYADGGLRTSCNDLARFATELLRAYQGASATLPPAAVRRMLKPQFAAGKTPRGLPQSEPNQGLFWQFRRGGSVGHSGGDPGLTAFFALDLAAGRARVFIANGDLEEWPAARAAFQQIWAELAAR